MRKISFVLIIIALLFVGCVKNTKPLQNNAQIKQVIQKKQKPTQYPLSATQTTKRYLHLLEANKLEAANKYIFTGPISFKLINNEAVNLFPNKKALFSSIKVNKLIPEKLMKKDKSIFYSYTVLANVKLIGNKVIAKDYTFIINTIKINNRWLLSGPILLLD